MRKQGMRRRQHQRPGSVRQPQGDLGRKLMVLSLAAVLLLAGIGVGAFVTLREMGKWDFFQVTATKIEGCRRTTKEEILALSGVDVHTNLLALNLAGIRKRIEAHAWVESAQVERRWPNRLVIRVKERTPVAMVNLQNGLYYLDRRGFAFAKVEPPDDMDYPVITGPGVNKKDPGPLEWVREALRFLKHANRGSSVLPGQSISEINVREDGSMVLFLVNRPFPIYLGKGRISTKYYRLAKVLYRLYKRKDFAETAYINMEYQPDRVLVGLQNKV